MRAAAWPGARSLCCAPSVVLLLGLGGCGAGAVQHEAGEGGTEPAPRAATDGAGQGRAQASGAPDGAGNGPCGPASRAGRQEVLCGEVRFVVSSPGACPSRGYGLVLDLHGYGMTAEDEEAHTRLAGLGGARGYVVVQPSAPGWPASWERPERLDLHPHDATVWAFVETTARRLSIPPSRVHVVGFSQGALVAFRLLAAHGGEIASVVAVAGADALDRLPARPLPVLYVHGRLDRVVPYAVLGAVEAATTAAWSLGPAEPAPPAASSSLVVRRTMAGVAVELLSHDLLVDLAGPLGGHCWPGPAGPLPFRCSGDAQPDVSVLALDRFDAQAR